LRYAERGWRRKYGKICVVFFLVGKPEKKSKVKRKRERFVLDLELLALFFFLK